MTDQQTLQKNPGLARWLAVTLGVSLLMRLLLVLLYQPIAYSDTKSYWRLAGSVRNGFERYDGTRTPGYPAFLALVGSDEVAFFLQMLMGLATTLLLFYIVWRLTRRPALAGLAGLAHSLNLGQLFFEANLLTETLTTFLLALCMAGMLIWLESPARRSPWLALALGLVSALALLVRPLFIFLPVWMFVFLLASLLAEKAASWRLSALLRGLPRLGAPAALRLAAFLLPVILLAGGWVTFIHARFGDWGLTTMTGYHLVQHTGNFFEYVPDEYADLRDTYLEYRDAHIAEYGTQTNTIWEAIPALTEVSGLHFYDLSRTLARISIDLILHHPDLYLRNVLKGWALFWLAPVYWQSQSFTWQAAVPALKLLIQSQRGLLVAGNAAFVILSLIVVIRAIRAHPLTRRLPPFFWFLTSSIWITSILQSLLDHGDNPRFLVPLQSLLMAWLIWVIAHAWQAARKKIAKMGALRGFATQRTHFCEISDEEAL